MAAKPKSKGVKWPILYGISGIVDLAQIIIDFTGVGVIVSEILEVIMPFVIIGFLALFKIPLFTRINRLLSIAAVDFADAITGGAAPFWIVDVWYLHRDVKKEEAEKTAQKDTDEMPPQLNQDGRREPVGENGGPVNQGGVRRPSLPPKPAVVKAK